MYVLRARGVSDLGEIWGRVAAIGDPLKARMGQSVYSHKGQDAFTAPRKRKGFWFFF